MGTPILPELLFEGIHESPKTIQATDTAQCYLPQKLKSKPLLLRTPHTSDTGLGGIKLKLTQEVTLTIGFFSTGRRYEACLV